MTVIANPPWETSAAYEQHYAECRHRVAAQLIAWGSTSNSKWPDKGRFIRITTLYLQPSMVQNMIELGRRSIQRTIPGYKLTELFPNLSWEQHVYDVYFVEVLHGNVRKPNQRNPELMGYITDGETLRCVHLGCNHPDAKVIRTANCYREYRCPNCEYTWGEDSSG
jgi:hypothetical protein